uniref:Reverse transcriptase zinc-binding domain-containing protein n=1 Tax=Quercus lobata TaxID=97700 RepID=A0A7N2KS32_QUELO
MVMGAKWRKGDGKSIKVFVDNRLPEKNGVYLVKSGYKLLCEEGRRDATSGSSREGMASLWSKIWKLKVRGKILHFLWKACNDCLPTKVNLMKRKVVDEPHCELCGKQPEDTKHALWNCEAMGRVWCVDFNWVSEDLIVYGTFLDLIEMCLKKPGSGELFGITAWHIWTHRNRVRLREKTIPLSGIGEAAKNYLQQVKAIREFRED